MTTAINPAVGLPVILPPVQLPRTEVPLRNAELAEGVPLPLGYIHHRFEDGTTMVLDPANPPRQSTHCLRYVASRRTLCGKPTRMGCNYCGGCARYRTADNVVLAVPARAPRARNPPPPVIDENIILILVFIAHVIISIARFLRLPIRGYDQVRGAIDSHLSQLGELPPRDPNDPVVSIVFNSGVASSPPMPSPVTVPLPKVPSPIALPKVSSPALPKPPSPIALPKVPSPALPIALPVALPKVPSPALPKPPSPIALPVALPKVPSPALPKPPSPKVPSPIITPVILPRASSPIITPEVPAPLPIIANPTVAKPRGEATPADLLKRKALALLHEHADDISSGFMTIYPSPLQCANPSSTTTTSPPPSTTTSTTTPPSSTTIPPSISSSSSSSSHNEDSESDSDHDLDDTDDEFDSDVEMTREEMEILVERSLRRRDARRALRQTPSPVIIPSTTPYVPKGPPPPGCQWGEPIDLGNGEYLDRVHVPQPEATFDSKYALEGRQAEINKLIQLCRGEVLGHFGHEGYGRDLAPYREESYNKIFEHIYRKVKNDISRETLEKYMRPRYNKVYFEEWELKYPIHHRLNANITPQQIVEAREAGKAIPPGKGGKR